MTLPLASTNAISAYKKACEILMFHYADRVGLNVAALRPPAVYGPMYYSLVNMMSRFRHAAEGREAELRLERPAARGRRDGHGLCQGRGNDLRAGSYEGATTEPRL